MTTLRIYGQRLGESDTWIDAEITQITLDDTIHLAAVNDSRTWEMPKEVIRGSIDEYTAGKHSNISHINHNVWNSLDGVRQETATEPFASVNQEALDQSLISVFKQVMAVMIDGQLNSDL